MIVLPPTLLFRPELTNDRGLLSTGSWLWKRGTHNQITLYTMRWGVGAKQRTAFGTAPYTWCEKKNKNVSLGTAPSSVLIPFQQPSGYLVTVDKMWYRVYIDFRNGDLLAMSICHVFGGNLSDVWISIQNTQENVDLRYPSEILMWDIHSKCTPEMSIWDFRSF